MYLLNIDRDKLVAAAGGDPWAVNATIQSGRPARIDRLARAFLSAGRSAATTGEAFAQALERLEPAWDRGQDHHLRSSSARLLLTTGSFDLQAACSTQIAADLEDIAAFLTRAQHHSAARIADLEERLAATDVALGDLVGGERVYDAADQERSLRGIHLGDLDQEAVQDTITALRHVVHIRDGYAGVLRGAQGRLRNQGYDFLLSQAPDRPDSLGPAGSILPIPSPDTEPEAVSKWWLSLTGQERAALIAEHSSELGNLNGIPVDVRSQANQAVLSHDLNRVSDLASRRGVPVDDVLADPRRYGLSTTDVCRYTNACRTQQGLASSAQAEDEHGTNPQVYLLKYQPEAFGGDGAAAIAMGNPDTAANTAVLVKGMGSGVRQGTLANPDGRRLYREANCADWTKDTAVVMWVGYDAPNSAVDPALYEPNLARAGGRALAADINALAVTHDATPVHMTVIGHSYGSTTVADAAAGSGMRANDVVLLGCPGTDLARSAADFHLPHGGHVFVGDASQDEVSWFGHDTMRTPFGGIGLGQDPAMDGYGSTRFKAEVVGYSTNPFYDHSHYFEDGSESLFSLGDVVSGHGDALERDHMSARHRGEYGLPAIVEPEAVRQATTGHRHSAPPR